MRGFQCEMFPVTGRFLWLQMYSYRCLDSGELTSFSVPGSRDFRRVWPFFIAKLINLGPLPALALEADAPRNDALFKDCCLLYRRPTENAVRCWLLGMHHPT